MMRPEEVAALFAEWRTAHRRDAWRPVIGAGETRRTSAAAKRGGEGTPQEETVSHFGGIPLLPAGEGWPACPGCGRPMQLFVQLDLGALPEGAAVAGPRDGVLQLFHCTSSNWTDRVCEAESETFEPFSAGALARVLVGREGLRRAEVPAGFEPFEEKGIVGWERFDDYPDPAEHERLGLEYEYTFETGRTRTQVIWAERGIVAEGEWVANGGPDVAGLIARAADKDKLGGWPKWVQGVEYPACPRCGREMGLVFQVDSEDHVPYMFGDVGCAHVTRCAEHPDVLAFGWACC